MILIALILQAHIIFAQEPSTEGNTDKPKNEETGPVSLFMASFSSIIVSELGDKTFFIAAIMAMRYNRIAVLSGALLALFLMTALSVIFGAVIPQLLSPKVTHFIITILFFFFGFKLLYDAYSMKDDGGENDEAAEVEVELNQLHSKLVSGNPKKNDDKVVYGEKEERSGFVNEDDPESRVRNNANKQDISCGQISAKIVFWQTLTMTFLGEWGDRSQITTIALAAAGNAIIVFVGSFLGHVICTSLAVAGGKLLAEKISERTVNIAGGILFLIFGIHNIFFG